jgi:hypothetical protein
MIVDRLKLFINIESNGTYVGEMISEVLEWFELFIFCPAAYKFCHFSPLQSSRGEKASLC